VERSQRPAEEIVIAAGAGLFSKLDEPALEFRVPNGKVIVYYLPRGDQIAKAEKGEEHFYVLCLYTGWCVVCTCICICTCICGFELGYPCDVMVVVVVVVVVLRMSSLELVGRQHEE